MRGLFKVFGLYLILKILNMLRDPKLIGLRRVILILVFFTLRLRE